VGSSGSRGESRTLGTGFKSPWSYQFGKHNNGIRSQQSSPPTNKRGAASSSPPLQLALQGAEGQVTSAVPILGAILEAASPART